MLSQLTQEKLTMLFSSIDTNKDGFVNIDDYEERLVPMARSLGYVPDSVEYKSLHTHLEEQWNALQRAVDKDGDRKVSLEEWLAYGESVINQPNLFSQTILAPSSIMFEYADKDGDGNISFEEFQNLNSTTNIDKSLLAEMFAEADSDKNGSISFREFIQMVQEFYLDGDPQSPFNKLFAVGK